MANEKILDRANLHETVQRQVRLFTELQDFSVVDELNSKLIKNEDTFKNNLSTNEKYFSRLILSRDQDEYVRGLFGIDLLSIVKNNFSYSNILNSSSPDVTSRFMNQVKIRYLYSRESQLGSKVPFNIIHPRRTPVATGVETQETLEKYLRMQPPLVQHFSFMSNRRDRALVPHEYTIKLQVDISDIYRALQRDEMHFSQYRQKIVSNVVHKVKNMSAHDILPSHPTNGITMIDFYERSTLSKNKEFTFN